MKIVLASTGTYHIGLGPHATACNSSGRGFRPSSNPVTYEQVQRAASNRFCKKCFPDGRPSEDREAA